MTDAENNNRSKDEPRGGTVNLDPIRDPETARERGRAGGLRSGVKRREKASLKEAARLILSMDSVDRGAQAAMTAMGLDEDERTNAAAITARMVSRATNGDVRAYRALSQNMNLLESDAVLLEQNTPDQEYFPLIDTASLIPGCYNDMWRDIMAHRHSEYIARSGRGSLKTTVLLTEAPIMLMLDDPRLCGVALRRVSNTLRDSIFAAYVSSIHRMGVAEDWEWTVSPMLIRRKATGQVILFRGLDDEEKSKGIQLPDPDMYLGFATWEEFDQNKDPKAVRKVMQTIKRGTDKFWTFIAFNTPVDERHWANQYFREAEDNEHAYTVQFNYLDVPAEFLGEEFIRDAEALKETNEEAYRNEYLGEAVGLSNQVFTNIEQRTITEEDIRNFKHITNGEDWGYAVDPWVFERVAYDRKTKTLYIFAEDKGLRLSNEDTAERIKRILVERDDEGKELYDDKSEPIFSSRRPANIIYADSAEPKSVDSHAALGLNVFGAYKWPNSVAEGIKWLQSRTVIVIDRKRCPLAYQEFTSYAYETDKNGEPIESYPDKDNHAIDAVRYALCMIISNRKEV